MNYVAHFLPSFRALQNLATTKLIATGQLRDGLYYFRLIEVHVAATIITHNSKLILWHQGLGHLCFDILSLLNDLGPFSIKSFNKCCNSCHRAKQARPSFPVSSIKRNESFELIHCDVWGPYHSASLSGAHYFLSIVDAYTRTTWVYLTKPNQKSTWLISFIATITRQL